MVYERPEPVFRTADVTSLMPEHIGFEEVVNNFHLNVQAVYIIDELLEAESELGNDLTRSSMVEQFENIIMRFRPAASELNQELFERGVEVMFGLYAFHNDEETGYAVPARIPNTILSPQIITQTYKTSRSVCEFVNRVYWDSYEYLSALWEGSSPQHFKNQKSLDYAARIDLQLDELISVQAHKMSEVFE